MSASQEVKQRLDIMSVVSGYVGLTKAGRNFKAVCPFHPERTPSFYVFPETQTWRCFGACGTGGDLFGFVMRKEQIDFGQALRLLAEKAGVVIQEHVRPPEEAKAHARLLEANNAAALYFRNLLVSSSEASQARIYVDGRGIIHETAERFLLGYSSAKWEGLRLTLQAQGFTTEELAAAGLVTQGDNGYHDRFRNRLMFPIKNVDGDIVGFGARALDSSNPKYLNTAQTALFDKSAVLYALDQGKDAIRQQRQAVIVEGYMDVITAHQGGFRNVVASMGTSLTERQVGLLGRYTTSLVLALDADTAGQAATLRGLQVAPGALGENATAVPAWQGQVRRKQVSGRQVFSKLPEGMPRIVGRQKGEIKVLSLPEGQDPDSLIREQPEQWRALVDQSVPMLDFIYMSARERLDLTTPKGKAQAVDEILPFIAELPNPVEQAHYLQRLAVMVGMDEQPLRDALPRKSERAAHPQGQPGTIRQHLEKSEELEEYCLALLLRHQYLAPLIGPLREDHFLSTENRELFLTWQIDPQADIREMAEEALSERLSTILDKTMPPITPAMAELALAQCIHKLEERRLRDLKHHHRLRFTQFSEDGADIPIVTVAPADEANASSTGEEGMTLQDLEHQELELNRQIQDHMRRRPLNSLKL